MQPFLETAIIVPQGVYVPGQRFLLPSPKWRRHLFEHAGYLGRWSVYSEITPQRYEIVRLKQRIRWRLDRPKLDPSRLPR
jgi:hypothetical protein